VLANDRACTPYGRAVITVPPSANTGWEEARVAAAHRGGYSPDFDLATYFLHDLPPEVVKQGEAQERPEADVVFGEPCRFEAWPAVPTQRDRRTRRSVLSDRVPAPRGTGTAAPRRRRACRGPSARACKPARSRRSAPRLRSRRLTPGSPTQKGRIPIGAWLTSLALRRAFVPRVTRLRRCRRALRRSRPGA
jgi:hypothetical protein